MKHLLRCPGLARLLPLALLVVFSTVPAAAQITGLEVPEMAHYDTALAALFDEYDIPGASVAVAKDGRLVYARGFGLADVEAEAAVQPDARFRLASISKPLTAVAVMRLVEEGQLDLDAPAFAFLDDLPPPDGQTEDPRLAEITIRDLLQHSGGWDINALGYDPVFNAVNIAIAMGVPPPAEAETVVRYMRGQPLSFDPGTEYAYSNLGYSILGLIVERVTGQDYEDFVLSVLDGTGIHQTELGRTLLEDRLPGEVRYYYHGGQTAPSVFPPHDPVPWPYGGFYLEGIGAAGGWVSSAPDLLRFMEAIDGRPGRPDVLLPETIQAMTARPDVPTWEGTTYWYGLGLLVNTFNNWWHDGSLPGTRTYLIRTAYQNLSYTVLTNTRFDPDNGFFAEMDNVLWQAATSTATWPTHDLFGMYTTEEPAPIASAGPSLAAAFPNPFAERTTLTLTLDEQQTVRAEVFDLLGRRVAVLHDGSLAAGTHPLTLDAARLPAGLYVVRAQAGAFTATRRVTIVR